MLTRLRDELGKIHLLVKRSLKSLVYTKGNAFYIRADSIYAVVRYLVDLPQIGPLIVQRYGLPTAVNCRKAQVLRSLLSPSGYLQARFVLPTKPLLFERAESDL